MVTAPLFIILALVAFGAIKWGGAHVGHMVLGTLLGLSLATTAIGGPILHGIEAAMSSVVSTVSSAAGGAR